MRTPARTPGRSKTLEVRREPIQIAGTMVGRCEARFLLSRLYHCSAIPAFGWGCEGHQMIALIARAHLTPAAAAAVDQFLRENPIDPGAEPLLQRSTERSHGGRRYMGRRCQEQSKRPACGTTSIFPCARYSRATRCSGAIRSVPRSKARIVLAASSMPFEYELGTPARHERSLPPTALRRFAMSSISWAI